MCLMDRSLPRVPHLGNDIMQYQQEQQAQRLELSPDQQIAFDKVMAWIREEYNKGDQELSLGGYAGTGKTTLIKELMRRTDQEVQVMSLTGKAVSVLIKKGVDAQTIHSTIYYVHTENKKPVFTLRSELDYPDLLVVDEASMVSTELYNDLLSFGIPILWVGDHGQLEPVGKNPGVMKNPQLRLEKIHRQAEGNPIIMLAEKIRKGSVPVAIVKKGDPNIKVTKKKRLEEHDLLVANQIIVGLNRTRVKINKLVRNLQRRNPERLEPGDRIVCLKNDRRKGLYNGLQGVVLTCDDDATWPIYHVSLDLDGRMWRGQILMEQFHHPKGLIETDRPLWQVAHFDYAYAVTCHKAQGSEWPHVMVVEESAGKLWNMARWRYTAVTRASERLTYAC